MYIGRVIGLLLAARSLRAFADGYVAVLLPAAEPEPIERAARAVEDELRRALPGFSLTVGYSRHTGDAGQIYRAGKEALMAANVAESEDRSPLAFEVKSLSPGRRAEIIAARDRYERDVRRMVQRGIRAGTFRSVDAKVAVFAILGAINWIARWYRPGGAMRAEELGARFADQLMGGLEP